MSAVNGNHDESNGAMSKASWHEEPVLFDCEGSRLLGIVAQPAEPHETGVVIIVGGPQYRAGSHRQFTLLARQLADHGIASIRFDYRGMGDSEGEIRNFENVDADIRAAIDALMRQVPSMRHVTLWGLCDAAAAALYYGHTDARVNKLVLLNPWVHSSTAAARARLKYYYLSRLLQRSFWAKLLSGKLKLRESTRDLASATQAAALDTASPTNPRHGSPGYISRMLAGFKYFEGDTLLILSGNDLTAQEFMALTARDKPWKKACAAPRVRQEIIKGANHTFSTRSWRKHVETWTARWAKESGPCP